MFSDTETVVAAPADAEMNAGEKQQDENTLGISGEIISVSLMSLTRDYINGGVNDGNTTESIALANVFFDARYKKFYKFFTNYEMFYLWKDSDFNSNLKECFIDTPVNNAVYLRWGKQVLQWGRCYLWNPTDVINVDKPVFIRRIGYRDGVYGLKIHIPRGTGFNFYGFIDTGKNLDSGELGGALKAEFLAGATEMAFSFWNRKKYRPVFGYDFSTRAAGLDVSGELSVSDGFIRDTMMEENGVLSRGRIKDRWITRASLNIGRSFDWNDQNEKIRLSGEFFYNEPGYREDLFADDRDYEFSVPVYPEEGGAPVSSGDKKTFLILNGLYEMNYCAEYYAAVFTTISSFFTSAWTLTVNWIENMTDYSGIFSTGIRYDNINDWYADFNIYSFVGSRDSEYTFMNEGMTFYLFIGCKF